MYVRSFFIKNNKLTKTRNKKNCLEIVIYKVCNTITVSPIFETSRRLYTESCTVNEGATCEPKLFYFS